MQLKKTGWILALTYCTPTPEGISYDHCLQLLDEMQQHEMNLLSVMMQSYGIFDPMHDGYAWPVQNLKLQRYRDPNAINANPNTEFLSKVIEAAQKRGIEVELFLNWGIWNHDKITQSYPDAGLQYNLKQLKTGQIPDHWVHCPDSPGALQLGIEEMTDLLQYYNQKNVTRCAIERLSYLSASYCYCKYTQEQRNKLIITHPEWKKCSDDEVKNQMIKVHLKEFVTQIKKVRPEIQFGLHTRGSPAWGHDPRDFSEIGVQYCEPHTIQFKMSRREIFKILDHLAPTPCYLHFDVRDQQPANYPIWIKTPKVIKKMIHEIKKYLGANLGGILFFNEATVSKQNREAVYDALKTEFGQS